MGVTPSGLTLLSTKGPADVRAILARGLADVGKDPVAHGIGSCRAARLAPVAHRAYMRRIGSNAAWEWNAMRIDLSGKRALVLGASGGLGAAIAKGLGAAGARVAVSSRSADKLDAAFPDHQAFPKFVVDLAAPGVGRTIAAEALAALGGIDILVNNSGGPPPTSALGATDEQWRAQFDAMVMSLVDLTGALIPGMRERRWGRVITVASSGIVAPIPNLALSNALRSALLGWSKTLASEVAGDGVTVNLVLPGRIATSRVEALDKANAARTGRSVEEVEKSALAAIPAGRYGSPEEFAAAAVFLASPQASYVTGTTIRVDGGALRNV